MVAFSWFGILLLWLNSPSMAAIHSLPGPVLRPAWCHADVACFCLYASIWPWITLAAGEVWKACCVVPVNRMTRLEAAGEAWKVCFGFPVNRLT
ncbi:hypothetical protein Nepgr_003921 [Nepenthes gracilis]|uniref:Secreted protein n=1 Tax=Nepenthes gracilis TaxID=150966 RepID=A0AAD3XEG3_NEPGR|nr:hypothetical protein Nepgr_003921 [Nepenthes gracilis]